MCNVDIEVGNSPECDLHSNRIYLEQLYFYDSYRYANITVIEEECMVKVKINNQINYFLVKLEIAQ